MAVAVSDVRAIISTDLTDDQVTALIAHAALLVAACQSGWTADELDAIKIWVTAHLIASSVAPAVTSRKLGDASETFQRATAGTVGLFGTSYGQTAISLDPTGCLASRGKTRAFMETL